MMKKNNLFFYSSNLSNLFYINGDNDSEYHPQLCFTYNKSGYLSNPIYGYVIPTIALVLLVLNSLAIIVFMTTNRKSPTNILLTALSLSDSLGVLIISPTFILVYGFENNFKVMKYPFCIFYDLSSYYSASMFHCISKWLTAILAIHRLIVVTMLFSGRRIATMKNSILGIVFIVIFSASINIIPTLHSKIYNSITLYNTEDNEFIGDICVCSGRDTTEKENLVVTWMKDTIGTILSCCILTVVTVLLIFKLKEAKKEMLRLQTEETASKRRKFRYIERTNKTIIIILVCFLATELPFAVVFTWIIVEPDPTTSDLDIESRFLSATILNLIVYMGFLSNFFIFMTMSSSFRQRLREILRLPTKKNSATKTLELMHVQQHHCSDYCADSFHHSRIIYNTGKICVIHSTSKILRKISFKEKNLKKKWEEIQID
ncbi:unnamed protein product [Mytilus coruscus]|uniref:G-protein coupled receptors family 1 profile domain-containing protein n=1 Tax=Mytilus coruscus TaxID=42192 RepID=A0A6J8CR85_MYTCO|nr:unnamed protein product [Mytilus coruscus]